MNVYIYRAALYCEDCGKKIRQERFNQLACKDHKGRPLDLPFDPDDETTYDSDNYPKGPYPNGGGEADGPQHCDSGPDCINAYSLSNDRKIGCWLENELTSDGQKYVAQAILDGGEVATLWGQYYADDYDDFIGPVITAIETLKEYGYKPQQST